MEIITAVLTSVGISGLTVTGTDKGIMKNLVVPVGIKNSIY
jgi:hypothetical protein